MNFLGLSQRVDLIVSILKKVSISNFNDHGMREALESLNETIEQSLDLIKVFADTSIFGQYWNNTSYQKQFARLNDQLLNHTITLNLALNVNSIFDHNQDLMDRQEDLNEILSRIDELSLSVTKQNKKLNEIHQRFDSLENRLQQRSSREQQSNFLSILKQDLQIEKLIGHGGFSNVYRGIWISRDHCVAIKVFHLNQLTNKIQQNIFNEISIMYQIRYDHLLGIFGACIEPNYHAIIVEYMPLGSLFDVLQDTQCHLLWSDRWSISLQMTKGINYLHMMSFIHQDIKSLNILLDRNSSGYLVKVSDFGLAKMQEEIQREHHRKIIIAGTLRWKAPELFQSNSPSFASDVYSLGIVFWELATRCIPYNQWNDDDIIRNVMDGFREKIPSNVPEKFTSIITNAWHQQLDKRPTCQQLIEDIKIAYISNDTNINQSTSCTRKDDEIVCERQHSTKCQILSEINTISDGTNEYDDNSLFITPPTILIDELKIEKLIDSYELHETIQLSERSLTDEDMNVVVELAIVKKQCRTLILYSNHITLNGAMILGDALHGNSTLEELYILSNQLCDLSVYYLTQSLVFTNFNLKKLNLADNEITDDGVQYLTDGLRTNETLTHLWLDNNKISNKGMQLLIDVLIKNNTTLSNLHVRENKLIDDSSISFLMDMFERNHSLKTLSISNCALSERGKAILKEAISTKQEFNLDI
ncbi:unnamed protein product [Rotaria sp. Silwood2]|nr:unnamed protein product [Rotaria sp. Silwood2]